MSLGKQFQIILISYLFGMIFLACYDIFNRTFYKLKGKLVRFVFELIFFSVLVTIYYFVIFLINDGILSIYMPLFLIIGGLVYLKFVSSPLQCLYEKIVGRIEQKLTKLHLFFLKKCNIMKLKLRKLRGQINEKIKNKRNTKTIQKKQD